MNTGVEILLQRMKDCPEDFEYNITKNGMSKWLRLVDHAIGDELLTLEEHEAIKAGMKEVKRNKFTEMVMRELAGEGESSDEGKWGDPNPYLAPSATRLGGATQGLYSNGVGGNATITTNATGSVTLPSGSITLGNTTLSEAGLKQMLATHRAMREETKSKRWWNKTLPELFGKK